VNTALRLAPWAASLALAALLGALPIAAAEGGPTPGAQGSPPPQIDSYQPFPAVWNQTITIHGSHLLPTTHPNSAASVQTGQAKLGLNEAVAIELPKPKLETQGSGSSQSPTPVPEGSKPILKWGAGDHPVGIIPASDIESWSSDEIRIKQLPGVHPGAYWIAVFQKGVRVSNRNRTLFFAHGDPNAVFTLQEVEDAGTENDEPELTVVYPPVQEPSQLYSQIMGYQPTAVGAGDVVQMNGVFANQGNDYLMVGTGNVPMGYVHPKWIEEWSLYKIRFENGFLPTGVYWIAVFNAGNLVSNLEWSLQVTEDPPPAQTEPGGLYRGDSFPRIPVQGQADAGSEGQSQMRQGPAGTTGLERLAPAPGTTGLRRMPTGPGTTRLNRIPGATGMGRIPLRPGTGETGPPAGPLTPRSPMQAAPRVKISEPAPGPVGDAEASGPEASHRKKARPSAVSPSPAPAPSPAGNRQPAGRDLELQPQRLR
jgi:hypothetical protein